MAEDYTYAVARIHAKEEAMLTERDMDRLIAASDFDDACRILAEKDFDTSGAKNADEVLERERKKTYALITELVGDMSAFDVFFYKNDFHNLKAAVKSVMAVEAENVFVGGGTVDCELILMAVKNREFTELPEFLRKTAQEALTLFLETGDGGLCDVIADKAYLETLLKAGEASDSSIIKRYAELKAALADIRIAARGSRLEKNAEFFKLSLVECKTVSVYLLSAAALKGLDAVVEYLSAADYREAADLLKSSYVLFEKWCDDRLMEEIKKEKHNQFTLDPICAYILARETELRMVGLLLTAKQNMLDMDIVKERLRELYV